MKCKYCASEHREGVDWYSEEFCTRSCAMNMARQMVKEYWKLVKLLREKK